MHEASSLVTVLLFVNLRVTYKSDPAQFTRPSLDTVLLFVSLAVTYKLDPAHTRGLFSGYCSVIC